MLSPNSAFTRVTPGLSKFRGDLRKSLNDFSISVDEMNNNLVPDNSISQRYASNHLNDLDNLVIEPIASV